MMASLTGCATSGPGGSGCATFPPIFMKPDDVLTRETLGAIVAHNETWEAVCGAANE